MLLVELLPFCYIADIEYAHKNKIKNGTVILCSTKNIRVSKRVNTIKVPIQYSGKHHEYETVIKNNRETIAKHLLTIIHMIYDVTQKEKRENLYIICQDGLQVSPFLFLVFLMYYGKMDKNELVQIMQSKCGYFFYPKAIYLNILK